MSEHFYFRVRGEVKGPFTREQIMGLVRKKRLGRHHELSTDAITWKRAGDFEGFFESIASNSPEFIPDDELTEKPPSDPVVSGIQHSAPPIPAGDVAVTVPEVTDSNGWHYARGLNTYGPITLSEIRAMLATGRLQGSDRVWNKTMTDWVPAEDVPQLMGSIRDPGISIQSDQLRSEKRRKQSFFEILLAISPGAGIPSPAEQKSPNLCRYLQISEIVCRIFLFVAILVLMGWYGFLAISSFTTEDEVIIVATIAGSMIGMLVSSLLVWFMFLGCIAFIEFIRVVIRIEHNTASN